MSTQTPTAPLARALAYLEKLPRAVSGSGGHKATFDAALACVRLGLSDGDLWEALQWFNANRCDPRWSERELRHKMDSAVKLTIAKPLAASHSSGSWRQTVKPVGKLPPLGRPKLTPRAKLPEPEPMRVASERSTPTWPLLKTDAGYTQPSDIDREYELVAAGLRGDVQPSAYHAYADWAIKWGQPCTAGEAEDQGAAGWRLWAAGNAAAIAAQNTQKTTPISAQGGGRG